MLRFAKLLRESSLAPAVLILLSAAVLKIVTVVSGVGEDPGLFKAVAPRLGLGVSTLIVLAAVVDGVVSGLMIGPRTRSFGVLFCGALVVVGVASDRLFGERGASACGCFGRGEVIGTGVESGLRCALALFCAAVWLSLPRPATTPRKGSAPATVFAAGGWGAVGVSLLLLVVADGPPTADRADRLGTEPTSSRLAVVDVTPRPPEPSPMATVPFRGDPIEIVAKIVAPDAAVGGSATLVIDAPGNGPSEITKDIPESREVRFALAAEQGARAEACLVVVEYPGFPAGTSTLSGRFTEPRYDVEVRVPVGAVVDGIVVDPEGRGVPEVRVALDLAGNSEEGCAGSPVAHRALFGRRETLTDAEGRFALPGVRPGGYLVSLAKDGFTIAGERFRLDVGDGPQSFFALADRPLAARVTLRVGGRVFLSPISIASNAMPAGRGGTGLRLLRGSFSAVGPGDDASGPEVPQGERLLRFGRVISPATGDLRMLPDALGKWAVERRGSFAYASLAFSGFGIRTVTKSIPVVPLADSLPIPLVELDLEGSAERVPLSLAAPWLPASAEGVAVSIRIEDVGPDSPSRGTIDYRGIRFRGGVGGIEIPPGRYEIGAGVRTTSDLYVPFATTTVEVHGASETVSLELPEDLVHVAVRPRSLVATRITSFGIERVGPRPDRTERIGAGTGGVAHVWLPVGRHHLAIQSDGYAFDPFAVDVRAGAPGDEVTPLLRIAP